MLSDRYLADALRCVKCLEDDAQIAMQTEDQAERDQAQLVLRLARPLRQKLETWVSVRALRAQLQQTSVSR